MLKLVLLALGAVVAVPLFVAATLAVSLAIASLVFAF